MISLLAPAALAAAAACLVPLWVHLVRRSDRRIVSFAALRFLRERPHARERLRLNEILLLCLRLVAIAGLAMLLALPIWRSSGAPQVPWILVAPGVDVSAARAVVAVPGGEWHSLAAGFPRIDALDVSGPSAASHAATDQLSTERVAGDSMASAPLASLLRQIDADLPPRTAVTVIVPAELGGLDAERLRLAHPITWRVLAGAVAHASSSAPAALTLSVRHDATGTAELPLVRALAAAWQAGGLAIRWDIAASDAPLPGTSAWLIWLAGPLPPGIDAWIRRGGSVLASRQSRDGGLVVLSDATGAPLMRERDLGSGRVLSVAGPLRAGETAAFSDPDFPRVLRELLRGTPTAPDRAPAVNVAPLPSLHAPIGPAQSLAPYLALALALVFLAERLVATRIRTTA